MKRTPLLIEGVKPGIPSPHSSKSHYLAIELSHGSKNALRQHFPSNYKMRTADHVTLSYTPSQEELDRLHNTPEHERTVNFHATHHVNDEEQGIHAVRIAGVDHLTDKAHPHITISHAPHAKPVQSNELLAQQQGDRIAVPRKVKGKTKRGHLPLTGTIKALPKFR